ncbi:MAG: CDP-glycerol glycerophosphotransferase family protein, partial [Brevibacterium aurantiacum]
MIRKTALAAVRSSAWKKTSRWIRGSERWVQLEEEFDGSYVKAEVIVYFGDAKSKFYQLQQWIPVLEELHKSHKVAIIFRRPSSLLRARSRTRLPLVLKRRFDPLHTFYHANNFKLALYVNNGMTNFQSLGYAPMVHVHINHGESDKLSMVSNQAKSYDRVFVAGDAAIERHRKALLDFDERALIKVGRPQLDIERISELEPSAVKTVMYAPTWEGENDANNYTSVDLYGSQIVEAALALENTRLIYKPHPRVE